MVIGAYLCSQFLSKPKPQEIAKIQQRQKCVAELKKKKLPDGSVEESFSFFADLYQSQKIKPISPQANNFLSGGGYADSNFKYGASLGVHIEKAEILGVKVKDLDLNAESDFDKDHRISVKKVLIKF